MQIRRAFAITLAALLFAAGCRPAGPEGPRPAPFIRTIPARGEEALVGPRGIAAASGRLFVVDGEGWIRFYDYEGHRTGGRQLVKTARGFPAGVTIESPTTVLVADTHEARILRLDWEGRELASIGGGMGSAPGEFIYPQRLALLGDEIFVTEYGYGPNNRVQVFGEDGTFHRMFGEFGSSGAKFARPEGIAVGKKGTIYVSDSSHRILAWTPEGEYLGDISSRGKEPGKLFYPFGLAYSEGWLYVMEYGNNRISRFREDGEYGGSFGSTGKNVGQFTSPRDLVIADRYLFVSDTGNDRVVRLEVDRIPWRGAER